MEKIRNKFDRKNTVIAAFSILLGFAGIFTKVFFKPSIMQNTEMGLTASIFTLENLGFYMAFTLLCYVILQRLSSSMIKIAIYEEQDPSENGFKQIFAKVFIINLACWGIWFWLYFPGTGMNDTINAIKSFHNDNQTLLYQIIIYFGINGLTKLTSNMTISYAILTMAQMIFMSLCIAWVARWLYRKRVRRAFINLFITYYALSPVVADYSITLVKDTLFGFCLMMMIPFLYDIVNGNEEIITDKKNQLMLLAMLLGVCFLRYNGKIIVFLFLLLLLIQMKHKRIPLILLSIIIIANGAMTACDNTFKSADVDFREAISIPLIQIGAVLSTDGYISEKDTEVLEHLLPLDIWRESYCFWYSDPIKFNGAFNNEWLNANKNKFIDSWFSILKNNFGIYVKAYLCHTYDFWNISPFNPTDFSQSFFVRINNNTGDDSEWGIFCASQNLANRKIEQGSVSEQLNDLFYKVFCISLILRPGIMFWITMWLMVVLYLYRKPQACLIFLPTFLNWFTLMLASPSSYAYRYGFYLTLSLPLLFLITLMQINSNGNDTNTCYLTKFL